MSNTPVQEPPARELSSGSGQTLPSRPFQPISDPSASKKVCFYKSGDYKFSGHRLVINARTFKTFDALLDALSKKVPLPFGVRTITTPRGTHLVRALDDLHDGGSYVCSDQKRVKPLNLDEVNRRQVPWNTTRPFSAGRQKRQRLQFGRGNDVNNRPAKVAERVAVRTPKRIVVIKNRDPTVKRTIVLQKRTAPTFDALLDYLSQILEFPVLKLFTTDGRRDVVSSGVHTEKIDTTLMFVGPFNMKLEPLTSLNKILQMFRSSDSHSKWQGVFISTNANTNAFDLHHLNFPTFGDANKVDGLAALILCSGVVVAAGNEPFRLGNNSFHRAGQMAQTAYMDTVEPSMLQPRAQNNKSFSSGRGSRIFSLSSERYIVNQVNKFRNGSVNGQPHHHDGSLETSVNHRHMPVETCETGREDSEHHSCILPQEDDIEKSFRVNQDGSMTVEMKVHLTIKEEELLQWTTTLSRSSLSKRTVCASISESDNSSLDSNNAIAKDSSSISDNERKEENHPAGAGKGVGFNDTQAYEGYTSAASGKARTGFRRTPTPGPRHVSKKGSVESVKMVTESEVQESSLGHYSYMERTTDGETTEGYCVVKHSSSKRPIPKPRRTASAGASKKSCNSSNRSSGVAEVLQIQNNGMEVTETVMHIYEGQGCYDNYFVNEEYSVDDVPLHGYTPAAESIITGKCSSSNDCDIDFSTTDSVQRQKEEMLSLSSEPITPTHNIVNNLSVTENEVRTAKSSRTDGTARKDKTPKSEKKKKTITPTKNQKSSASTSSSDKKQKESMISPPKQSKHSSSDKLSSNASAGKKSLSSSESAKGGQKSRGAEKPQIKKVRKDEKTKEQALIANAENVKRTPAQRQNINKTAAKDNGHNVNTPTGRPPMKKNMLDILQPKKSTLPGKKTISKPKSMIENRTSSPKKSSEVTESFSMPALNPSPSEIHQYVENWLEKSSPDPAPYAEEALTDEPEPQTKVVFQIGADSESDEKNECQTNLDEYDLSPGNTVKKSASCLTVPLCHAEPATALLHSEQPTKGLCVSMPSVRVDPVHQENRLRAHKSAEALSPDNESSSSASNILSPKAKLKPVLQQLCSSVQCIRRASDTNTTPGLEKSNSLPDFPMQVASVFGSSCKAFLSFLSVMTLRDNLTGSIQEDGSQSRSVSEAMLMMESLQKISAIEDEEEQRASLSDLRSRASSQFRERWRDFQILRERLESEPLSPKVSETEFALDVVSEVGDVFEDPHLVIDELMEELNMPQDLREQITSTIQQARSFYPADDSTFVETERNQSDSEEDVEKFVEECSDDQIKQSPEPDITYISEQVTETKQDDDSEQAKMMTESEQEPDKVQETDNGIEESVSVSQTERDELLKDKENEEEEQMEESEEDRERMNDRDANEMDDEGEETEMEKGEREEEAEERTMTEEKVHEREEWETEKEEDRETVEKETEEEATGDEEGEELKVVDEDQEATVNDSEETDEREADEATEEEEKGEDEGDVEVDEEENEVKKGEEAEEANEFIEETDEGEELDHIEQAVEEEEADAFTEDASEEVEVEAIEEKDEVEKIIEDMEEEDEVTAEEEEEKEMERVTEEEDDDGEDVEETNEEEDKTKVVSEEDNVEEERGEDGEGVEVKNIEERAITDEEEEDEETDENIEEEENCDEGEASRKEEEEEVIEEMESEENIKAEQTLDEEEREEDEENEGNELNKGLDQVEEREVEEESAFDDPDSVSIDAGYKNLLDEASYLQQQGSCDEESNVDTKETEHDSESPTKYSSEGQCEDDKGTVTDTINELDVDEGGEHHEEKSSSLSHSVEISQELLDFVNSALQSSSLIFAFDSRGNIRIEPDNARVVQTKQTLIPKSREDSSYGLKRLPSPSTSDLSDYRPETSESGGYKSQDSVDVVTESGEESEKPFPVCRRKTDIPNGRTNVERANSKLSVASNSEVLQNSQLKSGGSFSSFDSGSKASREDLSYFSAASSQKADAEPAKEATQCISFASEKDSVDGVLIDRGRWLLKENHLIRKSPPLSLGMYDNVDSTSVDTGQENMSEDSPPPCKTQNNPLAAISSSELEEMAKPKCTYYNMPHGSDSDPFMDDSSLKSGKNDTSSVKGRGFRVSPAIDTTKTWPNKNGSLSSFASVEFKVADRRVHPEGETSAVTQPRRTSSGRGAVMRAQDSLDTLHVRCGQYCPIL